MKLRLLKVLAASLAFVLIFYVIQSQFKKTPKPDKTDQQVLASESQKDHPSLPVRLKIPAINVNAVIERVGITKAGEMDVASNTTNVAWFGLGTLPGENGSAVIAGHFDNKVNETEGVFAHLNLLKEGDKLHVEDSEGGITTFVVRQSRTYNPGLAEEVFSSKDDGAHLNLITCHGIWNDAKKSYSKRLVVFADLIR